MTKKQEGIKMKNMISLDNGNTWMSASEAMDEIRERGLWEAVVNMMDDEIRNSVCDAIAPCTDDEFLGEYLACSAEGLVIG